MGFYQPPQFGSNRPKFTGDEQGGAPPPIFSNYDDLVGYYQFNEVSGDLIDLCGSTPSTACGGHDFTNNGATYGAVGIIEEAFQFDGINDFCINSAFTELNQIANMTWNTWFYQEVLDVDGGVMGTGTVATNSFAWHTWRDGNIYIETDNSANVFFFDYSTVVTAQEWTMMTLRYDGTGATNADRMKFYVNGTEVTLSFIGTVAPLTFDTDVMRFGDLPRAIVPLSGRLDEISLWTRTLSEPEITELYNGGAGLALF